MKSNSIQTFLKPKKTESGVRQGYFKPNNPEKYIGDINKIIYRSSWEFKFLKWCDSNPKILQYASEPTGILYYSPLDQRTHRYFVDFYIIVQNDDGTTQKWIIEIKPIKYIKKPIAPKRMTAKSMHNYAWAAKQFILNTAKFEAANEYAKQHGLKFGIITENFIFNSM